MIQRILDNDLFVSEKLERLVNKYPHRNIIISNGEIFTGDNAVKEARKKYRRTVPMFFRVPSKEEFNHLL